MKHSQVDDLTSINFVYYDSRAAYYREALGDAAEMENSSRTYFAPNLYPDSPSVNQFFSTWFERRCEGNYIYIQSPRDASRWDDHYTPSGFERSEDDDYDDCDYD